MIHRENLRQLCRSQVSVLLKHKAHRHRLIYVAVLLILILLLLMPLSFHHSKPVQKTSLPFGYQKNYHSALEANLAKLRQFQTQKITPIKTNRPVKAAVAQTRRRGA